MKIPQLDLKRQYKNIKHEILPAIEKVIDEHKFILGPEVSLLEEKISSYVNTKFAIGVASGSDALLISLMALNITEGDGIITTPFTFFATAGAIARLGATPVFVDIEEDTYNINPTEIEKYIDRFCTVTNKGLFDKKTQTTIRGIIPVHLYGQTAEMENIIHIAKKYNLWIVEDGAQALGAEYQGEKAGSIGTTGIYSFFPSKNLGGFGDGGMVVTNDETLAEKLRILRVHGSSPKYYHKIVGINSRLDTIQAAVLLVKLKYLEQWTQGRRNNANLYEKLFNQTKLITQKNDNWDIILPAEKKYNKHVYNQYTLRAKNRDQLKLYLEKKGVGTALYYPLPLHMQECFENLGYRKGDLPVSERITQEVISIPIFPELTNKEIEYIVSVINDFYK